MWRGERIVEASKVPEWAVPGLRLERIVFLGSGRI
jgi:hypothetical protein